MIIFQKPIHLSLLLLFAAALPTGLAAQTPEAAIVGNANSVLNEIMAVPAKQIPQSMFAAAEGIAIVPNVIKGGFVIGVRHGKGVVVVRDENRAWQAPVFITLSGGSVGWQAGLQATDVILVFKTKKSVQGLMSGKFTIGVDAAAAAGPVGRQAAAATDTSLGAEIYSYSRSRGLFAGVALDGSVLQVDGTANQAYYQGGTQLPPSAGVLLQNIARYSPTGAAPAAAAVAMPAAQNPAPAFNPGTNPNPSPMSAGTAAPASLAPATAFDPGTNPNPNPIPGGAAAPASLAPADPQALPRQLAASSQKLGLVLDDTWKQFLALPPSIYTGTGAPPAASVNDALKRFDSVAKDPRYTALVQRPEFRETYTLLQNYAKQLSAQPQGSLLLPPPPGQASSVPQATPRY